MAVIINGDVQKPSRALKKAVEPQTYFIQKTIRNDTYMVMAQSQVELEDEFTNLYFSASQQNNIFLEPPYSPFELLRLVISNNVLAQCVEAMEVNVDGTGHEFVPSDTDTTADPEEEAIAQAFFNEPYPGLSTISIRRKLRYQLESVGYAFLEVLRTVDNNVVGFRNVETHNVRMVKLDAPVLVQKTLMRGDKEVTITLWERERRFAQRVALKTLVYYKEFGVERNVNRDNGQWETVAAPIPANQRGTELLMVTVHPDIITPYGVPRWINEMPSVVGSRKAEEQNLEFLDSGGMPPAIIFVQGGTLAKDASDQLRMYLSGQNKNKNRAVVVEAQSSSGSIESAGTVQVKVERFGAEQAKDAMFMKYDEETGEHVREGFRLPPLFLGKAADYNFATAVTAYMVAEAQVFKPERMSFDEIINMTIMKSLGLKTIKFKSLPITLQDVANQMKALGIVKDIATRDSMLEEINKITGMSLDLAPEPQPDSVTMTDPVTGATTTTMPSGRQMPPTPGAPAAVPPPQRGVDASKPQFKAPLPPGTTPPGTVQPKTPGKSPTGPQLVKKPKAAMELIDLAHDYAIMRGLIHKAELTPERELIVKNEIDELVTEDRAALNRLVSQYTFGSDSPDLATITARALEG